MDELLVSRVIALSFSGESPCKYHQKPARNIKKHDCASRTRLCFLSWRFTPNTRHDETVLHATDATRRWVIGGRLFQVPGEDLEISRRRPPAEHPPNPIRALPTTFTAHSMRETVRERQTHAHTRRERERKYVLSAIGLKFLTGSWRWGSRDGGDFTHSGSSKTD
jgi:hypothetical protein